MSAFKKNQPEGHGFLGYFHSILVMLSGLFIIAIAITTILLLHFPPDNRYFSMDLNLTTRLDFVVYMCAFLLLFGIVGLVFLAVLLLCCHDTKKQRTIAIACCLTTTLLSLGIIVLFAVQPQVFVDKVLPRDDVIFQPVNESYVIAMETFGYEGNEEFTENMKRLQVEENCCLQQESRENSVNCAVLSAEASPSRPAESCIHYFYGFYQDWIHRSLFILRVTAVAFSAVLGLAVITHACLLASHGVHGVSSGSYTVERRRPSKYRQNLSSFTYVAFQPGASAKGSPASTMDSRRGLGDTPGHTLGHTLSDTLEHTLQSEIFYIAQNDANSCSQYGSSICVMHSY